MAGESTLIDTFGFHSRHTMPAWDYPGAYPGDNSIKEDTITVNILQILGYIPIVGFIPCTGRLIVPLCKDLSAMHEERTSVKIAHYIRGAFEGLGIGSLYLIPDLAVTAWRFIPHTRNSEAYNAYVINGKAAVSI